METNTTPVQKQELLFKWTAKDYHEHKRGKAWLAIFSTAIFGVAIYAIISGDWMMSIGFFVLAALYFYHHRNENESHEIGILNTGIIVDQKTFIPKERIEGYWFVYDETISVLNIEIKMMKKVQQKTTFQMGEHIPDTFRMVFNEMGVEELKDKKESLADLWGRALKL